MVGFFRNALTRPFWRESCSVRRGLLIVSFCLLITGPARNSYATCGDWLEESHPQPDSMTIERAAHEATLPTLPCECQGPMCGSAPAHPPMNAPEVELNLHRDMATLREPRGGIPPELFWQALWGGAAASEGFPGTIDRPPRFA